MWMDNSSQTFQTCLETLGKISTNLYFLILTQFQDVHGFGELDALHVNFFAILYVIYNLMRLA